MIDLRSDLLMIGLGLQETVAITGELRIEIATIKSISFPTTGAMSTRTSTNVPLNLRNFTESINAWPLCGFALRGL